MSNGSRYMYDGRGKRLRAVTGSTNNVPVIPELFVIPNGGYSEIFPLFGVLGVVAEFVFGAAATGDVIIEQCSDQTASGDGSTFDTVTVTAALTGGWKPRDISSGYFRFKNTSGQTLQAYINKQIST